jgi:hypothetical protein
MKPYRALPPRLLVTALVLLWAAGAAWSAPRRWAVLVGVDRYLRNEINSLHFAVADVKALARALESRAGYARDDIFVLTSDQTGDEQPTRGNLAFRLGWLAEHVQPGDSVLFFFSGHGMEMDETPYLLTMDADARNAATLKNTALSSAEVRDLLKVLRAREVLVLLDACRSDPRSGKGSADNRLSAAMARDLVLVPATAGSAYSATMFACSEGQRSYEWADRGHGFFTWFLLQAFEGAASPSKTLTLADLRRYLEREVPKATERVLGQRQVPKIVAFGADQRPVDERRCQVATLGGGTATPVRPEPLPAPSPTPPPARPSSPGSRPMERDFVGTWQGSYGGYSITWHVHPDGRYAQDWIRADSVFRVEGTLTMEHQRWTTTSNKGRSAGSYRVVNHNAVWMSNDFLPGAVGTWVRVNERP